MTVVHHHHFHCHPPLIFCLDRQPSILDVLFHLSNPLTPSILSFTFTVVFWKDRSDHVTGLRPRQPELATLHLPNLEILCCSFTVHSYHNSRPCSRAGLVPSPTLCSCCPLCLPLDPWGFFSYSGLNSSVTSLKWPSDHIITNSTSITLYPFILCLFSPQELSPIMGSFLCLLMSADVSTTKLRPNRL